MYQKVHLEKGSCAEIPQRACESQQVAEIIYAGSFCFTYTLKRYTVIVKILSVIYHA